MKEVHLEADDAGRFEVAWTGPAHQTLEEAVADALAARTPAQGLLGTLETLFGTYQGRTLTRLHLSRVCVQCGEGAATLLLDPDVGGIPGCAGCAAEPQEVPVPLARVGTDLGVSVEPFDLLLQRRVDEAYAALEREFFAQWETTRAEIRAAFSTGAGRERWVREHQDDSTAVVGLVSTLLQDGALQEHEEVVRPLVVRHRAAFEDVLAPEAELEEGVGAESDGLTDPEYVAAVRRLLAQA